MATTPHGLWRRLFGICQSGIQTAKRGLTVAVAAFEPSGMLTPILACQGALCGGIVTRHRCTYAKDVLMDTANEFDVVPMGHVSDAVTDACVEQWPRK
mmetsp:Transcript_48189/g.133924  ORF Transcript_48189/g.133924 Transcript_48189/m.133924 type:complete len:98 (+) Transcript_48189:186-479(+)